MRLFNHTDRTQKVEQHEIDEITQNLVFIQKQLNSDAEAINELQNAILAFKKMENQDRKFKLLDNIIARTDSLKKSFSDLAKKTSHSKHQENHIKREEEYQQRSKKHSQQNYNQNSQGGQNNGQGKNGSTHAFKYVILFKDKYKRQYKVAFTGEPGEQNGIKNQRRWPKSLEGIFVAKDKRTVFYHTSGNLYLTETFSGDEVTGVVGQKIFPLLYQKPVFVYVQTSKKKPFIYYGQIVINPLG